MWSRGAFAREINPDCPEASITTAARASCSAPESRSDHRAPQTRPSSSRISRTEARSCTRAPTDAACSNSSASKRARSTNHAWSYASLSENHRSHRGVRPQSTRVLPVLRANPAACTFCSAPMSSRTGMMPGSMLSPTWGRGCDDASSSSTLRPRRANAAAAVHPAGPPPMTMTSTSTSKSSALMPHPAGPVAARPPRSRPREPPAPRAAPPAESAASPRRRSLGSRAPRTDPLLRSSPPALRD